MNCRQFEHVLDAYLDGDLSGTLKLEFETHLMNCAACGHRFGMMEAMGEIIAAPAPDEPVLHGDFADRVLVKLHERQQDRLPWRRWMTRLSMAASVALAVSMTILFSMSHGAVKPGPSNGKALLAFHQPSGSTASAADGKIPRRRSGEIPPGPSFNLWLAGTLERAGSNLWELNALRTSALDQLRQGVFSRLVGPAAPLSAFDLPDGESGSPETPAGQRNGPAPMGVESLLLDPDYELL